MLAVAGLVALPWLAVAPNRLLPGVPVGAFAALGPLVVVAAGGAIALAAWAAARWPATAALLAMAAALALLGGSGTAAERLLRGGVPAARAALGGGAWLTLAATALLLLEALRPSARPARLLVVGIGVAALPALVATGSLGRLSLAVEYAARAGRLHAALFEHLALAFAALALAAAIAAPLALWASRAPRVEAAASAVLDGIQVIPAIALFGLLLPLLSLLLAALPALRGFGVSAIGTTPAVLATGAYVALPLFRSLRAGLGAAPPAVIEAGRAMGFSDRRILAELRLPLGLPVFRGGARVAAVQAIGLATLGGLVGAGGLGAIVFEGMAQFSADLILLGALPIAALALVADALLAERG